MANSIQALNLKIFGIVQGVGFRPFVYRLATEEGLFGWIRNTNKDVELWIEGEITSIDSFKKRLAFELPPVARIVNTYENEAKIAGYTSFEILQSVDSSDEVTSVSPDIAVCYDCLRDLKNQERRKNYPLINCTNCGPRFSIIRDVPYDRKNTTMDSFPMCTDCEQEYNTILDRRFHAQPIACNHCGPVYSLCTDEGKTINNINEIINLISEGIDQGNVYAIKGTGGFHLACDALNNQAVERIRKIKIREGKPFAVMFRTIDAIKKFAFVSDTEQNLLTSYQRPIVLLKSKKSLSSQVTLGLKTVGAMLPYMPFHFLLFEQLSTDAIVLTSANFADEPLIIDNEKAIESFNGQVDGILLYNREIYNRVDDSVCMVVNDKPHLIRRSRGFVPLSVDLKFQVEGILATGAELNNCFCIGKDNEAIMSQHIGDLKNLETYDFYTDTIERFKKLYRVQPELIVHDMHPDYLSTRYAENQNVVKIAVQHHHAHVASCMAEHGLDEQVIGIALDGTGYGTDGNIWGGEFLIADLKNFERAYHFEYIPMPGGDKVVEEPWRMAVAYLLKTYGTLDSFSDLPFLKAIEQEKLRVVTEMIEKGINSPLTSSAGRLFDAVSAILNICTYAGYHAEAPMRLEDIINEKEKGSFGFEIKSDLKIISFSQTIRQIVDEITKGTDPSIIAARFHNTIIRVIVETCEQIRNESTLNKVVLSGGSFQNRYLLSHAESILTQKGFDVYAHSLFPCNDGGIALGQLAIGGKRMNAQKRDN